MLQSTRNKFTLSILERLKDKMPAASAPVSDVMGFTGEPEEGEGPLGEMITASESMIPLKSQGIPNGSKVKKKRPGQPLPTSDEEAY